MSSTLNEVRLGGIRLIGYSLAGEETVVAVPELNVCFDIGRAPPEVLSIDHVLLTHGHMDHSAGIAYYFSQRNFVGNAGGTVVLPKPLVEPVERLMDIWGRIEGHRSPARIVGVSPGEDYPIRRGLVARAFRTVHGGPCLGYSVIDIRQKLLEQYLDLPGPQIAKLRREGTQVTRTLEVPLVCYCGDTAFGPFLDLPYVKDSKVLVLECTFVDPMHRSRAAAGNHLHIDDFCEVIKHLNNEYILLTHLSRRTSLRSARAELRRRLPKDQMERIVFLMAGSNRPKSGPGRERR